MRKHDPGFDFNDHDACMDELKVKLEDSPPGSLAKFLADWAEHEKFENEACGPQE